MRVVVCHPLPEGALTLLSRVADVTVRSGGAGDPPLAEALSEADGAICLLVDRLGAAELEAARRLRVVSSVSVGLDHIDVKAATALGIPVGHTPGVLADTTADLAFALLLATARRVVEGDRWVRSGGWAREADRAWRLDQLLGRDVHGATLGVIGLGAIGRAVARRAAGFGMRVLGWSRTTRTVPGVESMALEDLLRASDFVSVHVALAPETRGLLGREALALLRPHAVLVNTARGGIVDEDALAERLRTGRLAGAALDVFAREPLPPGSPLLALENVVLTPHIGSASVATRARMVSLAVENLRAGLAFERLASCANPDVYASDAYRERRRAAG